jgi:hypothetical protein
MKRDTDADQRPRPAAIDWPAIEREYRAGQLSNRELERVYQVSEAAIRKRAKRDGWTRDLVGRVGVEIERKLLEAEAGVLPGQRVPDQAIVERAAERVRDVVLSHRERIARLRTRLNVLELEFDALPRPDTRRELCEAVGQFQTVGGALDKLVSLTTSIIHLERQAYSLDKGGGDDGAGQPKLSPDQRAAVLRNLRARVSGPESVG